MKPSKKDMEKARQIIPNNLIISDTIRTMLQDEIAQAIAEEREKCAGIAEKMSASASGMVIAAAIRRNDEKV